MEGFQYGCAHVSEVHGIRATIGGPQKPKAFWATLIALIFTNKCELGNQGACARLVRDSIDGPVSRVHAHMHLYPKKRSLVFTQYGERRTGDSCSESPWASGEPTSEGRVGRRVVHEAGRRAPGKVGHSSLAKTGKQISGGRSVTSELTRKGRLHHPPPSRVGIPANPTSGKPGAWGR